MIEQLAVVAACMVFWAVVLVILVSTGGGR